MSVGFGTPTNFGFRCTMKFLTADSWLVIGGLLRLISPGIFHLFQLQPLQLVGTIISNNTMCLFMRYICVSLWCPFIYFISFLVNSDGRFLSSFWATVPVGRHDFLFERSFYRQLGAILLSRLLITTVSLTIVRSLYHPVELSGGFDGNELT